MDAHFWPPNNNVPHERLYVRAGTVPCREAADARRLVEQQAIPRLVDWIAGILRLDVKSPIRRKQQVISFSWDPHSSEGNAKSLET